MDFGHILDDWEKIRREHKEESPRRSAEAGPPEGGESAASSALKAWLDANPVDDKDAGDGGTADAAERKLEGRRLAALRPQATLDLHGKTADEAESAIAAFIDDAARAGLEKVLLITGKGLHSEGAPVLKRAARRALEAHPAAGRFGEADRKDGGTGALWVLVRKRRP